MKQKPEYISLCQTRYLGRILRNFFPFLILDWNNLTLWIFFCHQPKFMQALCSSTSIQNACVIQFPPKARAFHNRSLWPSSIRSGGMNAWTTSLLCSFVTLIVRSHYHDYRLITVMCLSWFQWFFFPSLLTTPVIPCLVLI